MNRIKQLVFCATLASVAASTAQAQDTTDMSKFTCEQFLAAGPNAVETAIWLSGYYNGLHKNTVINLKQFTQNAGAVVEECKANPKNTVMQTVDGMLSRKK